MTVATASMPKIRSTASVNGVVLETLIVTPEQASEWLNNRGPNRQVSQARVQQFARDMRASRWAKNGETIKFDEAGLLIDGQHRLEAIVQAGVQVPLSVAWNVPSSAMPTIDAGRARGFGDVLHIRGVTDHIAVSAVAALVRRWESGNLTDNRAASHTELDGVVARHSGIVDSVAAVRKGARIAPVGILAFVHYIGARANATKADEFIYAILNGTTPSGMGLSANNAAFRLRERLIGQKVTKARLPRNEVLALTIRAWNFFLADRPVVNLRWRAAGPRKEEFPSFGE